MEGNGEMVMEGFEEHTKENKYAQERKLKLRGAYDTRAMKLRKECASAKRGSRIGGILTEKEALS